MTSSIPQHEKLFDEICSKLNELSHRTDSGSPLASAGAESSSMEDTNTPAQPKYEQMQTQMKKFNSGLKESQEEIKEKIKSLGNVTYGSEGLDAQVKQLAEQLNTERSNSSKLGGDLAKSLELCLQLQLEIQGLKARAMQIQAEEKKYSQALLEKNKTLQKEVELQTALKEEMAIELTKAKNAFLRENEVWHASKVALENEVQNLRVDKAQLQNQTEMLNQVIANKDQEIASLNQEIEKISTSFDDVESSAEQQGEILQNLMEVAETKIVEMKLALDKKSLEAQDYHSHLQQALTQLGVHKQENAALKDYIAKLNYYHQQVQAVQQQQIASHEIPV